MASCREMATVPAGYILQQKVSSTSSGGFHCVCALSIVEVDEWESAPCHLFLCSIMHSISSVTNKQTKIFQFGSAVISKKMELIYSRVWNRRKEGKKCRAWKLWQKQ